MANGAPNSLSNVSLRWMVRQVIQSQCGITFVESALEKLKLSSSLVSTNGVTDKPVMNNVDAVDALQPLHDALQYQKLWWILEILPMSYTWQDDDGVWHSHFGYVFIVLPRKLA